MDRHTGYWWARRPEGYQALVRRYLEAAQKILDRVIITPSLVKVFPSAEMTPEAPSKKPGRRLEPGRARAGTRAPT